MYVIVTSTSGGLNMVSVNTFLGMITSVFCLVICMLSMNKHRQCKTEQIYQFGHSWNSVIPSVSWIIVYFALNCRHLLWLFHSNESTTYSTNNSSHIAAISEPTGKSPGCTSATATPTCSECTTVHPISTSGESYEPLWSSSLSALICSSMYTELTTLCKRFEFCYVWFFHHVQVLAGVRINCLELPISMQVFHSHKLTDLLVYNLSLI